MMITIAMSLALALPSVADAQASALPVPSVADAMRAVRAELKDPDSAKFRGIKPLHDQRPGASKEVNGYCGFVNAKNGYGGYTGESSFFVSYPKRKVMILPPELSSPTLCD